MTTSLPAPTTAFELRRHLTSDHHDDRWGGNWTELNLLHRDAHAQENVDHIHRSEPA